MMARTLILSLVGLLAIVSPVYLMFVAISDQSQLYLRVNGYLQPLVGGFIHRLSPVLFHRSRPALPPGADTVMMR